MLQLTGPIELYQLLVLPDSNYLAIGNDYTGTGSIYRATATKVLKQGLVDTSFGNGYFTSQGYYLSPGLSLVEPVEGILHSNGFITLVTSNTDAAGNNNYLFIRLNPAGKPDSSFGTNSILQFSGVGYYSYSLKTQAAANDKFYVLGSNKNFGDSSFVSRFLYNGKPDSSFGINGRFVPNNGPFYTSDMSMLPDSTLVLLGTNDYFASFFQGVTPVRLPLPLHSATMAAI